jgi:hypothetical protein
MAETTFEQKFGQLVDAQISERLPSLVEYRVGFQVIDKTEDDTRAVGVAAFVMNGVWMYIPVFFLKGKLKGFDLLWIKQQDLMVPSMDNWIAALQQEGLSVLGQGFHEGLDEYNRDTYATPGNTRIYDPYSQMGKTAFDANDFMDTEDWQKMARRSTPDGYLSVDLPNDMKMLGKEAAQAFLNTLLNEPSFAQAMFQFYDVDTVEQMAKTAAEMSRDLTPEIKRDVLFVTDPHSKEAADLNDREKELLMRKGIYIRDERDSFSQVFQEEVDSSVIQNPTCPGIYDVLMLDGEFRPYIILCPVSLSQPGFEDRRFTQNNGRSVALIDIAKPKNYLKINSTAVFCKPATEIPEKAVSSIQGGRKATKQMLLGLEPGTNLMFVQSPTRVLETILLPKEQSPDGAVYVRIANTAGDNARSRSGDGLDPTKVAVEFVGPEARLKATDGYLFIPEGTRCFTDDDRPDILLGNSETVAQQIYKNAGVDHIEIYADGDLAQVFYDGKNTGLVQKIAALRHLVLDHGINAATAQMLLTQAHRADGHRHGFLIKHAAPYDTEAYGDSRIPFMAGPGAKEEYATQYDQDIKGGKPLTGATRSDNVPMLPQQAIQSAMRAAESGIKEVFDVKVLQGLIDKADIGELRKDYIVDMIRGMDKVGRMLFLFYWHNEDFEERYGKEDMIKLEDTLRDVFNSTGDLVLFLKEKTAYSPDASEALFGQLSEDIAT